MGVSESDAGNVNLSGGDGGRSPDQEQVESLRVSAAAISKELKALSDKVAELVSAVESLSPAPVTRTAKAAAPAVSDPASAESEDSRIMTVTVSPLPELAMAAVAETTLRNLPSVRQVSAVKREGDWARFTLEVTPDADLETEMRAAMPVSFQVTESTSEAVSMSLEWAWGPKSGS